MNIEAIRSSETSGDVYETKKSYSHEDLAFSHSSENLGHII
jgi:hypothetical protein